MQVKSDSVIGGFVKEEKGGDEHIHTCLSCGENKLSINQGLVDSSKAGCYHCWHCDMAGRDLNGVTFPVYTVHRQQITPRSDNYVKLLKKAHADTDPKEIEPLLAKRGIGPEVIRPFHLTLEPDRVKQADSVAMPMFLNNVASGFVRWRPGEAKRNRYKDAGNKGIAGEDIEGSCTHVVLAEGMFDAFKIWEVIHDQWRRQTRFVFCTCGSSLTPEQVCEVLGRVPEGAQVFIAFDNDKLSAAVAAYNALRPYRKVHVALPPSALGDDWDRVFKEDPGWAKKYWVMALQKQE